MIKFFFLINKKFQKSCLESLEMRERERKVLWDLASKFSQLCKVNREKMVSYSMTKYNIISYHIAGF